MTKMIIKIDLKPFKVPNHVIVDDKPAPRQDGLRNSQQFPLTEVDVHTLHHMCKEFRQAVFQKAGKKDTFQNTEES